LSTSLQLSVSIKRRNNTSSDATKKKQKEEDGIEIPPVNLELPPLNPKGVRSHLPDAKYGSDEWKKWIQLRKGMQKPFRCEMALWECFPAEG